MLIKYKYALTFSFLFLLVGCQQKGYYIKPLSIDTIHSGQSNLHRSKDGKIYLTYVEYINDSTDALMMSVLEGEKWSTPKEIVRGTDWFTNWADFPSLCSLDGGKNLIVHWLQKSTKSTYDYDIKMSISLDKGDTWAPAFLLNEDGIEAEHGFVSITPLPSGNAGIVWLDGRNTGTKVNPAMTIRYAEIDANGNRNGEVTLDERVCDCCKTGIANADDGPVVVYRDRSKKEIRDIGMVRKSGVTWSAPKIIHDDGWEISGCPVNGPAVDAHGKKVAIAWYEGSGEEGKVWAVTSLDGGRAFGRPVRIDGGKTIGRVDIEFVDDDTVMIIWMEERKGKTFIMGRKMDMNGVKELPLELVHNSPARSSGFPVMEYDVARQRLILAWTDALGIKTKVQSGLLEI